MSVIQSGECQPPEHLKIFITLYFVSGLIFSLLAQIFILGAMGAPPPTPKICHYPLSCVGAHLFTIGLNFYFGGDGGAAPSHPQNPQNLSLPYYLVWGPMLGNLSVILPTVLVKG